MMHFLNGGNWQDGTGVDFHGFTKVKNQPLMVEDIDGLSDRQIMIRSGGTGWTRNKCVFFEGYGYGARILEPEVHCAKEELWIW